MVEDQDQFQPRVIGRLAGLGGHPRDQFLDAAGDQLAPGVQPLLAAGESEFGPPRGRRAGRVDAAADLGGGVHGMRTDDLARSGVDRVEPAFRLVARGRTVVHGGQCHRCLPTARRTAG
jgi:hypothetical protein